VAVGAAGLAYLGPGWAAAALAAGAAGAAFVAGRWSAPPTGQPDPGARDALERARGHVTRAREERDQLQSTLAHDLRSPLGAIVNFASVLEEDHRDRLDPEARGVVARMRRAAENALRLADGLSRLTRVSRQPATRQRVEIEPLVREAFASIAPGRPVELSIGELPPAFADRALLAEAFGELLENAVKFSGHREKPRIAVGGRREADGRLVYWVADDGVGFPPEAGERLFRAFERLHGRDAFPGAGIGLAVVQRALERLDGAVWAEGDPERGARFFLSLPREAAA
jgi:signal transduction histidine kinase